MVENPEYNLRAVILSESPIIIATETYGQSIFVGHAAEIASVLSGVEATILVVPAGQAHSRPDLLSAFKKDISAFREKYPNIRMILMANEEIQVFHSKEVGLEAVLINQNAFIDESQYQPADVPKQYDAVYNAQLMAFKRHWLAEKIKRLALVYYGKDIEYFNSLVKMFPHAYFANGFPELSRSSAFKHLDAKAVSLINSSSSVGLCLSKAEGAMYASVEYLLCGIPCVTTPNIGGRNVFFNDRNSMLCDESALSVCDAVEELKNRNLDPMVIRRDCVKQMNDIRNLFFELIERIRSENGFTTGGYKQFFFDNYKINRIWKSRTDRQQIAALSKKP